MFVYIESINNPRVRFLVVEYDKDTGQGRLKGGYGATITRNIRKEELIKRGYKIVTSEKELDLTPPPMAEPAKAGA